jgi:hypothetical protein
VNGPASLVSPPRMKVSPSAFPAIVSTIRQKRRAPAGLHSAESLQKTSFKMLLVLIRPKPPFGVEKFNHPHPAFDDFR